MANNNYSKNPYDFLNVETENIPLQEKIVLIFR